MNSVFEQLNFYFEFPFVRYAMVVGMLIALCCALFGVILVLKRFSFLGDGLSHTAFGALAIATALRVSNEIYIVLPVTAILAVALLKKGRGAKVKGDAALAMMSVGALAIGYMILSVLPGSNNVAGDVCSTLFGATSILTLEKTDVLVCAIFAGIVIALFIIFYNRIFAVTFDESFSVSTGINADSYNTVIAVITAIIIVVAMELVGSLLISALIVFPALSAMRVCKSFRGTVAVSGTVAVFSAAFGIVLSILASTPVGPSIVVMNIFVYAIFCALSRA